MYVVNNRIDIASPEQLADLKERFSNSKDSMKQVPGFISFRLLEAEDGTHLVAETTFEEKQNFLDWLQSEHFKRAHGGKSGEESRPNANVSSFFVAVQS